MVTHEPGEKNYNITSFHAGYKFSPNSNVKVQLGTQNLLCLPTEKLLGLLIAAKIKKLVTAINKESTMTVLGTSSLGTKTEDIYSLTGSSRALAAINQACGVR